MKFAVSPSPSTLVSVADTDLWALEIGRRLDYLHEEVIALRRDLKKLRKQIQQGASTEMATLADLQAKVAQERDLIVSIKTFIADLAQKLRDALAANDPAQIQALADELDANNAELAGAMVTNTPAAPPE